MTSCGGTDDGLGKRFPVSGTVTYNGKPLEKGAISFVPEDRGGIGATGSIENGSYTLSTGGNNDGARAGKYKVTITAKEDSTDKAKAAFGKAKADLSKQAGTEDIVTYQGNSWPRRQARPRTSSPPGTAMLLPQPSRPRSRNNPTRSTSRSPTPKHPRRQRIRPKAMAARVGSPCRARYPGPNPLTNSTEPDAILAGRI